MAKLIKVNGETEEVSPKNGTSFELEELQKMVGGLIQILATDENLLFVMNEEGKVLGLPANHKATEIFQKEFKTSDFLVGDVLICNDNEIE